MQQNGGNARELIRAAAPAVAATPACACDSALAHAIMTAKERIPAEARERLGLRIDRYL